MTDEQAMSIANAITLFLVDRIADHDEFFDTEGNEHVLDTCVAIPGGEAMLFIGGERFHVRVTHTEE